MDTVNRYIECDWCRAETRGLINKETGTIHCGRCNLPLKEATPLELERALQENRPSASVRTL